ncbi:DUF3267 domain-containing protein [Staphylococcus gallinarum]|uniref:DUF3267 domain-containing protein n=1 Tax=Staphylococcus gallinarum TaxID=1293 RepID=A0A3A0VMS2_STAGA|nr:DUF3267 domain-containing protein [Staphylococcus gallinarum]RIP33103.1 DUF3267 domain-containing protein [Staphylococcus gallinarum]
MFKIDLLSNKKALERFILFQLTVVMISILFSYKLAYSLTHIIEQNIVFNMIYGILGFTVIYFLHELIHIAFFKLFSKGEKPTYKLKLGLLSTHMPNVHFKRWQYIIIMLAPLVVITLLLFTVFSFYAYSSILFIASIHVGYCVLDMYFVTGALNSKVKLIEDTEEGILFYTEDNATYRTEVE